MQNTILLHLVMQSPSPSLANNRFQTFFVFDDLNPFEGCWLEVSHAGLSYIFYTVRLEFGVLGEKTTELKCHSHHIMSRVHVTNVSVTDDGFNHLTENWTK